MSIRDEILKYQGILTEAKLCPGEGASTEGQALTGKFGNRTAEFGVRRTKEGAEEIFFKIKTKPFAELPPALQEDCPVVFPKGVKLEAADVRIEKSQWLTERITPEGKAEDFFAAQTEVSVRDRLTLLRDLASRIDDGSFSLGPSIDAHVKMNIRRLSWVMAGGLAILVLSVVAVSAPFFRTPLGISDVKEERSGDSTLRSTRIARAQAKRAMGKRTIVPPGSNVFLMVTPDKNVVTLGEKVTLLYEVLSRYSAKCWGFSNEGKFQNFRAERRDSASDTSREVVRMNGKKYLKFPVGTATLVPQRAGEQLVYPGTAFVSARADSGQILDIYLTTKPLPINVVQDSVPEAA